MTKKRVIIQRPLFFGFNMIRSSLEIISFSVDEAGVDCALALGIRWQLLFSKLCSEISSLNEISYTSLSLNILSFPIEVHMQKSFVTLYQSFHRISSMNLFICQLGKFKADDVVFVEWCISPLSNNLVSCDEIIWFTSMKPGPRKSFSV